MVKKRIPPASKAQPTPEEIERFASGADDGVPARKKSKTSEETMRFNANIPKSLYLAVKVKAAQKNVKLNDLAIEWMQEWLKKE
jgi:predicted HicB family RNase H-like nuclease